MAMKSTIDSIEINCDHINNRHNRLQSSNSNNNRNGHHQSYDYGFAYDYDYANVGLGQVEGSNFYCWYKSDSDNVNDKNGNGNSNNNNKRNSAYCKNGIGGVNNMKRTFWRHTIKKNSRNPIIITSSSTSSVEAVPVLPPPHLFQSNYYFSSSSSPLSLSPSSSSTLLSSQQSPQSSSSCHCQGFKLEKQHRNSQNLNSSLRRSRRRRNYFHSTFWSLNLFILILFILFNDTICEEVKEGETVEKSLNPNIDHKRIYRTESGFLGHFNSRLSNGNRNIRQSHHHFGSPSLSGGGASAAKYHVDETGDDFRLERIWRDSNDECGCWNSTSDNGEHREVECKCDGLQMITLNPTLPQDVYRITVTDSASFTRLDAEQLKPYRESLREIVLSELPFFREFGDLTFIGMRNLDTIYLHDTPSLTSLSRNVFKGFLPKLKIIRIHHTSLETVPNLSDLRLNTSELLHTLDLENNKIKTIQPGWIRDLSVDYLALSYNHLEEIGPKSFEGANIARLSLKGNRNLRILHADSFVGIDNLLQLDLSDTSITQLPTQGLKHIERLRLENVFTLTVIPSIYYFQDLKEAILTYPYHCCAFEFPETHDPKEFSKYKEFVKRMEEVSCHRTTTTSSTSPSITDNLKRKKKRKKRQAVPAADHYHQQPSQSSLPSSSSTTTEANRIQEKQSTIKMMGNSKYVGNGGPVDSKTFQNNKRASTSTVITPSTSKFTKRSSNLNSNLSEEDGKNKQTKTTGTSHVNPNSLEPFEEFDPFIFDPDKTFGSSLDPKDVEQEHIQLQYGNPLYEENDDDEDDVDDIDDSDFGTFHLSVPVGPPIMILCGNVTVKKPNVVLCSPQPDAFNPCEDIMDNYWLRVAVWVVVSLALIGNTAVLVVLLLAPGRMSVQRFLMANLSFADLCMGIYLMMIATEDLISLGSYFNYAIEWQQGWGCKVAGFLTVFASELSVTVLAVITGERWYALTRAMHLTKRLTIIGAAELMSTGWLLSIVLAALPLVGVSSYSKTSICLPMEASTTGSQVYLAFLLFFNGIAFLLVALAYWQMYRAVANHGAAGRTAAHSGDAAIAKKMGLLVFTDFACFFPVAFFGLTAVAGYPLIGVTDSKILLVFFYPLNAMANPYLYAIMTKQYRRDLLSLLSRHGICAKRAARFKTGHTGDTNNTLHTMQTILRLGSVVETTATTTKNGGRVSVSSSLDQHCAGGGIGGGLLSTNPSPTMMTTTAAGKGLGKLKIILGGGGGNNHFGFSKEQSSNINELKTINIIAADEQGSILNTVTGPATGIGIRYPSDDDEEYEYGSDNNDHLAETSFISTSAAVCINPNLAKNTNATNNITNNRNNSSSNNRKINSRDSNHLYGNSNSSSENESLLVKSRLSTVDSCDEPNPSSEEHDPCLQQQR